MLDTELLERHGTLYPRPIRQPARTCHKEMGCTADYLLRALPTVAGNEPLQVDRQRKRVVIGSPARQAVVDYTPQPHRRLGSLSLPVLTVGIDFHGFSGAETRAFLAHFDRCFLRMGG